MGKTIKFIRESKNGNWLVFEEEDKVGIVHICKGDPEDVPQKIYDKRKPGSYNTVGWVQWEKDKQTPPTCEACKEEVPKAILMMVTIQNIKL